MLLAIAAALTVANVVRLAAHARRDEIEIMQLVGAPLAYIRGPFVAEGVLQGGVGALVAIVCSGVLFVLGTRPVRPVGARRPRAWRAMASCRSSYRCLLLGGMLLGCSGRADRGAQGPLSSAIAVTCSKRTSDDGRR